MAEKKLVLNAQQMIRAIEAEKVKLEVLDRRLNSMQSMLHDIQWAHDALSAIAKTKPKDNILVSLGAGVFVEASVENSSRVMLTMAGDVLKYYPIAEAGKDLEKRITQLNQQTDKLRADFENTAANLNKLDRAMSLAINRQGKNSK